MHTKFYKRASSVKDPFLLYRMLRFRFRNTALLESLGEYNEALSRYTILGVFADELLYERDGHAFLQNLKTNTKVLTDNWCSVLEEWCGPLGQSGTPFQTGVIGYIGYENNRFFERLPNTEKKKCPVPQLFLVRYSLLFVYDRKEGCGYWISDEPISESLIQSLERKIKPESEIQFRVLGDVVPDFTRKDYLDSINRCISYIARGDMLQANITMRFHGRYSGDPFLLYQSLRKRTPNPFFAYLDFPGCPLISTSPESFLIAENGYLTGRPIKGTVQCVIDGKDQKEFLCKNVKDLAENVMITDLIRNDIGRVSRVGTVEVPILCRTKCFNQLYHLETMVTGKLKENVGASELLRTNFPGGSISGAPKIRAMEVIDELEFTERGPYCGAIGFWGTQGYVNTSIGIRVLYFTSENFFLHAGGGITIRSDAENEYEELCLKIEPLLHALNDYNILSETRQEIDLCNKELLRILSRRFAAVEKIGLLKKMWSIPVLQGERVREILEKAVEQNKQEQLGFTEHFLKELFDLIILEASERESQL